MLLPCDISNLRVLFVGNVHGTRSTKMWKRHLGRELGLRTPRDCLCGSWRFSVLMVLAAITSHASGSAFECCPENTIWVNPSFNCSDGSRIRLNCHNNGSFYSLNPTANHFDEFTVVERGGSHLEFIHDYDSIPAHRFCVSGNNETDRWALVCFDDDEENIPRWRYLVFGILSLISAIFLSLTLAVYTVLPELRDIQDKAMASAIAFLASSYFLLAIEQIRPHPDSADLICVPLAFALYWTFLSAFFWMNLVAFNVWRSVWFKNFPVKDKDLFLIFCAVAFVGPGFFLIAALATHHTKGDHLKPLFGENTCWFGGNYETWAFFYGPVAVLLMLNVIYLGLTCWRLWIEYRGYTGSGLRSLRFNCLLYVKLVLVMGITWIFEVISFAASPSADYLHWFATDVLNSMQGVIIFILLVATRQRVKKLLARRKPCGLTFPKSWAACDEGDEIVPALPVEIELSNSP